MPSLPRYNSLLRPYTAPANLSKFSMNNHTRRVITRNARLRANKLLKGYKHHTKKFNVTHEPVTRGEAKELKVIVKPRHTSVKNGTHRRRQ